MADHFATIMQSDDYRTLIKNWLDAHGFTISLVTRVNGCIEVRIGEAGVPFRVLSNDGLRAALFRGDDAYSIYLVDAVVYKGSNIIKPGERNLKKAFAGILHTTIILDVSDKTTRQEAAHMADYAWDLLH